MKISTKQYAETLLELTQGKTEQELLKVIADFALQLKKAGQLKNAKKIMEKFSQLHAAANGIVMATVTSSRSLSSDQVHQVASFVKEKYSAKEVEVKNVTDEKIGGGIIIKVGDEILDASISSQLKRLKKQLIN